MVTGTTITLDLALVTLDQQGLLRAPAYIAGANRLAVGDMATVACPATAQGPSCRSRADSSNRGRLLSPEGLPVGISYTPWLRDNITGE